MIDHSAAFLPIAPIGSHCRNRKYDRLNARRNGIRIAKRKMWKGRCTPAGSMGIGRKGAMPVPIQPSVTAPNCVHLLYRTLVAELRESFHQSYLLCCVYRRLVGW